MRDSGSYETSRGAGAKDVELPTSLAPVSRVVTNSPPRKLWWAFVAGQFAELRAANAYLFTVTNWATYLCVVLSEFTAISAFQQRVRQPHVQAELEAEGLLGNGPDQERP